MSNAAIVVRLQRGYRFIFNRQEINDAIHSMRIYRANDCEKHTNVLPRHFAAAINSNTLINWIVNCRYACAVSGTRLTCRIGGDEKAEEVRHTFAPTGGTIGLRMRMRRKPPFRGAAG
ncbi:hypothetical protein KDW61_23380 [Burkholderia cenocepacia]|uniref:hypothetical protein n=1 Tax=Burkholderia TaxID=32008 RepID=UPI00158AD845|nr:MULTISPECIES: hypothetical protein [Burkholderia]MBR8211608.1 hypothetical protein [Burkholderia cenocepacia]